MDQISICEPLLNRNKIDAFLKRLVTGDEKLIIYDNVKRNRSWLKGRENDGRARIDGQEGFAVGLVGLAIQFAKLADTNRCQIWKQVSALAASVTLIGFNS